MLRSSSLLLFCSLLFRFSMLEISFLASFMSCRYVNVLLMVIVRPSPTDVTVWVGVCVRNFYEMVFSERHPDPTECRLHAHILASQIQRRDEIAVPCAATICCRRWYRWYSWYLLLLLWCRNVVVVGPMRRRRGVGVGHSRRGR